MDVLKICAVFAGFVCSTAVQIRVSRNQSLVQIRVSRNQSLESEPARAHYLAQLDVQNPRRELQQFRSFDGHMIAMHTKAPKGAGTQTSSGRGSVLLLHGGTNAGRPNYDLVVDGDTSHSVLEQLSIRGYRGYAMDFRGHGSTAIGSTPCHTIETLVKDIIKGMEYIVKKEGRPLVLLSQSMSTRFAAIAAKRRPDLVQALVFIAFPPFIGMAPPGRSTWKYRLKQALNPCEDQLTNKVTREFVYHDFDWALANGHVSPKLVEAYADLCLATTPVGYPYVGLYLMAEGDLANITLPTLFIQGDHDDHKKDAAFDYYQRRLKGPARRIVIPNGDHEAHLEHTSVFIDALLTVFPAQ